MIKNFKITPVRYADSGDPNKTLVLDLFNPYENGVAVKNAKGLGPVKAKVSMSDYASMPGTKFTGSRQSSRSIGLDLVFLDDTVVVETLRHRSYLYFPVGEKVIVEIETDYRKVKTEGYVESNEPSIWGRDLEGCNVSILCESPYLEAPDVVVYEIASIASAFHFPFTSKESPKELLFGYPFVGDSIIVHNDGEIEAGCIFEIIALKDISNPTIYHPEDNTSFQLLINMDAGDKVIINTKTGQKSAVLKRGKETHNVINYIKEGSVWFSLKPGDTVFSILYSSTITKTKTETNPILKIHRNGYVINDLKIGTADPSQASVPSLINPVEIPIPERIGATAVKKYWSDEHTDTSKYDISDESFTFEQAIDSITEFGGGYIDTIKEELMVTRVKIPIILESTAYQWVHVVSSNVTALELQFRNIGELVDEKVLPLYNIKANSVVYSNKFSYMPSFNGARSLGDVKYLIDDYFATNSEELYLCGIFWDNVGTVHVFEAPNPNKKTEFEEHSREYANYHSQEVGYIICELNEPKKYRILSSEPSEQKPEPYVVNSYLLNTIHNFIRKNHAIVNTIEFTSIENSGVSVTYNIDAVSEYDYYNFPSGEQSVTDIPDGYHGPFTYFVCNADYNSEGYTHFSVMVSNSKSGRAFEIDWSTLNVVPFYGGIVDFINGKLIGKYDSEGNPLQEDEVIDISDVATAVGAPNDQNGYTIPKPPSG